MNIYNLKLKVAEYIDDIPSDDDAQAIAKFLGSLVFEVESGDLPEAVAQEEKPKATGQSVKVITKSHGPITFSDIKSWFVSEDGLLYLKNATNERVCAFAPGEWVGVYPVDAKE